MEAVNDAANLTTLLHQPPADKSAIATALSESSERCRQLLSMIPERFQSLQILPYLSQPLWDFGHMANVEERWLCGAVGNMPPIDRENHATFNAMLQPRMKRGELQIKNAFETFAYRDQVRQQTLRVLREADLSKSPSKLNKAGFIWWNTIIHEHQHQETVLQSVSRIPIGEFTPSIRRELPAPSSASTATMIEVDPGPFEMGVPVGPRYYDCESPNFRAITTRYEIGKYPVTNGEFLEFLEEGGYEDSSLWDEAGIAWLASESHHAPLHWALQDEEWVRSNRNGVKRIKDCKQEILIHVTHHEAKAFAKFVDARLPSEAEWEKAARFNPETGLSQLNPWGDTFATPGIESNCDVFGWQPSNIGTFPLGASPLGMEHACGDVWEWSADQFHGYPGFKSYPYRDYAEAFYNVGQYTLRGGSWASRQSCATATFRNWDLPSRRQIHVGFRLARD